MSMIHSLLNDKNKKDEESAGHNSESLNQPIQHITNSDSNTSINTNISGGANNTNFTNSTYHQDQRNSTPTVLSQPQMKFNIPPSFDGNGNPFQPHQQQHQQNSQIWGTPLLNHTSPTPSHHQHQHQISNQPFQPLHPQQQMYQTVPSGNFFQPYNVIQPFQPQFQQPQPFMHQVNHQPRAPPKRRRAQSSTGRRRTMTACESCRLRKIKCDLGKPVCSACNKSDLNCVYRNVKKEANELSAKITKIAGVGMENQKTPQWSSCNWYTKVEGVLKWPIFENKYHTRPLNTVLAEANEQHLPLINGVLSKNDINELNIILRENIISYIDGYLNFIQTKNPFIDSKALIKTSDYIKSQLKEYPNIDLINLKIPEEMIPMPLILLLSASSSITHELTFKNLEEYGTSISERSQNFELSYKLYIVAQYLNLAPKSKIDNFNLDKVQFYLLKATYLMYIMKPLEAWNCVFEASTLVMTILESYKNSGRKFTEAEHRLVERVFHTCLKYESEFRVELSPSIPSSGIVNYPFPNIYPSPPIESISSVSEESSWFFYLTEIVLRKFENRMLDEFFIPIGTVANEETSSTNGEFLEDQYKLNWEKYDMETIMAKSLVYLEDLDKIESSMITHLRSILKEEPASGVLQPHGFLFKTKSTISSQTAPINSSSSPSLNNQTPLSQISQQTDSTATAPPSGKSDQPLTNTTKSESELSSVPHTPSSESRSPALSDLSQRAERVAPDVPETINFIRTRMIVLKVLLFRPLVYLFIHDKSQRYNSHPFIEQVLTQCFETIDTMDAPLACHRHFGSWFYARNVYLGGVLIFALFKKVREKYCSKHKILLLLRNILTIFDYWIDEMPDLAEPKRVILGMLDELATF